MESAAYGNKWESNVKPDLKQHDSPAKYRAHNQQTIYQLSCTWDGSDVQSEANGHSLPIHLGVPIHINDKDVQWDLARLVCADTNERHAAYIASMRILQRTIIHDLRGIIVVQVVP